MSRKQKIYKPLSHTLDEVLEAVAKTKVDEKKRAEITKKFKKEKSNTKKI